MAAKSLSSSSTEGLTKLEDQLTCPICLDHFTNPKFLPCFHSFCLRCLERVPIELVKGSHYLPCPTCRLSCPVPDKGLATLPSSFVINNLIEVHGLMKKVSGDQHTSCDNCDKSNIANRYCKQCAKFFCPDCLHHHDKWKPHAAHETITLEEVASTAHELLRTRPQDAISCTEHDEPLKVFCETCQELVCHLCTVKKHKDHEYDVVSDVYKKYRSVIDKSSLQPLNQEFDQLTSAKTILVSRIEEIDQQAETTSRSIDRTIAVIKVHLDATGRQMKDTVSSARKLKVGILKCQLDELETRLDQVSECRNQVKQSVEVATPHQLVTSKKQIMKHSSNVIDSTGDKKRFQPLEQADIELVKAANIHSKIGDIKFSSPSSTKVCLVGSDRVPLTSQPSTITVSLSLPDGSPAPIPSSLIKCHLTHPNIIFNEYLLVKESTMFGQYDIFYTPVTKGQHQLHIAIQDREIQGSPVSISVLPQVKVEPAGVEPDKPVGLEPVELVLSVAEGDDTDGTLLDSSTTSGNTSKPITCNVYYSSLPSIGCPPGLVPDNTPFTSGGNLADTTAGRHPNSVITGPSYGSSGSSGQPLLKPASFTSSSTFVVPNMMKTNSTKVSSASSASSSDKPLDQKCPICLEAFKNPKATECCKNLFCSGCLKKALKHSPYCPTCKTPLKPVKGNQPNGTMNSHTTYYQHLPGFEKYGTIVITYRFQNGTQGKDHPNPGQPYSGISRTAYLPDNHEGRHVLKLLHRAFDAGLVFTIGTSITSGQKNTVIWNDIRHKTNTQGGSTNYGYPDDTYLKRVQEELKAKGIY